MSNRTTALAALAVLLVSVQALAVSPNVVISQVYGGGGNSGATYTNDFIELFNRGAASVSVTGWSVQYASATGSTWFVTNLSGTIPAGGYYLVQEAAGSGGTTPLPTPDATGSIAMSASAGKVALVNTTTALTGTCPSGASIVDLIGYGSTANCFEGAYAPGLSNTTADFRAGSGCTDTDSNSSDFSAGAPNPRNSSTAVNVCGGDAAPSVSSTVPANNASCIPASTNISVTFSEAVDVTGTWFTISCTGSLSHTASVSGGPTTFTLDPDTDFSAGDVCTVTIVATQVTDQDIIDPPDNMVANYAWSFTIPGGSLTPIHDIQGNGASSPLAGNVVTTRGVVTGVRVVSSGNKGFFIQEPDATADADPMTSEGILVYTGSSLPADAVIGNLLEVRGTVSEFVPSADPYQPPVTELTSPAICLISTGNALPAAVALTPTFPNPAGAFDQLERVEGMRVSIASLTVTGPTIGYLTESSATSTSDGIFFGVVTGVARPFREPGIQYPDPAPSGSIPPIPRWDTDPEVIRVDTKAPVGGSALDVGAGTVVTGLAGPLDYTYRRYVVMVDPTLSPGVSGGPTLTAAPAAGSDELTVASFNVARFFDTTDDPTKSDAVLTPTAFANRLAKLSIAVRDYLRFPDIIGLEEVENLTTLQAIGAKISADAVANSQPDPLYVAYLSEGNDPGGIDVGFLVKTAVVTGSTARVSNVTVTQEGLNDTWVDPADNVAKPFNDRPPLVLTARVNFVGPRVYPVTVIVNHLRSLNGVDDPRPDGLTTAGERVRLKRKTQADFLANLIQARQTANPAERIVVLGDLNAFEFNDGYVDMVNTIAGTPTPDAETVVPGDGADLVNPDLSNLTTSVAASDRYSYTYDGIAQSLDHILVNAPLLATATVHLEHARINADFADVTRNNSTTPARTSDHDPAIAYVSILDGDGDGILDAVDPCNDLLSPQFATTYSDQFEIRGTVYDCSGVESVAFQPGSSNFTLEVLGNPGDTTRPWRVRRIADNLPCDGELIAYDTSGAPGTEYYVGLDRVLPVPALDGLALALLAIAVALAGAFLAGRRSTLL